MFDKRWKYVGPVKEAQGEIFRVVDAAKRDIVAFTELRDGKGSGHTWRGTADEFKKQFTMLKPTG